MERTCPHCRASLPAAATRYCVQCGGLLPSGPGSPSGQPPAPPASDQDAWTITAPAVRLPPSARPTAPPPVASPPPAPPDGSPTGPERRRKDRQPGRWIAVAVAVVVLAAAGTGGYVLFGRTRSQSGPHPPSAGALPVSPSGGGSQSGAGTPAGTASPAPSPAPSAGGDSEQAQLTQLAAVLHQSAAARADIDRATQDVGACSMPPSTGITIMNRAISLRQSALGQLAADPLGAVAAGGVMSADLQRVLRRSITADRDYIGWMKDIRASGCPIDNTQDPSWQAGLSESGRAVTAKNRFLSHWNGPAAQFGLPTYTPGQL